MEATDKDGTASAPNIVSFSTVANVAPGAPGKPTAVAGVGTATVSIVAPTSGDAPTSYTVTSNPGAQTCTVTVPATSCTVAGLTNGTSYTFTSTASNSVGTSAASAASDPVTPNRLANVATKKPKFVKTSHIKHPGRTVLLKQKVRVSSGAKVKASVYFGDGVQRIAPLGDAHPSRLGWYRVTKSGKVIAHVKTSQPLTIILKLHAKGNSTYDPYTQVKTWSLR